MNGFQETAWLTNGRTNARANRRDSLGLQRLKTSFENFKPKLTFFGPKMAIFEIPMQGFWENQAHKFSTGPQLSEYVWIVCCNMKGTCLKSVSKTPTFRFFRDSQPLKRHTSSQMANFGQFLAKMGKTGIFFKKAVG